VEVDPDPDGGRQRRPALVVQRPGVGEHLGGVALEAKQAPAHTQVAQDLGIAQDVGDRGGVVGPVGVQLPKAVAQARLRVLDGGPSGRVGQGMGLVVVHRTGPEQRPKVGEVAVDGHPVHASALGDVGDLGGRRAAFAVQRHGGLDDAAAGVGLPLGALFELVSPRHDRSTYCSAILTGHLLATQNRRNILLLD
jgi:hypothetical protein